MPNDVRSYHTILTVLMFAYTNKVIISYKFDGYNIEGQPIYLFKYGNKVFKVVCNEMDDKWSS